MVKSSTFDHQAEMDLRKQMICKIANVSSYGEIKFTELNPPLMQAMMGVLPWNGTDVCRGINKHFEPSQINHQYNLWVREGRQFNELYTTYSKYVIDKLTAALRDDAVTTGRPVTDLEKVRSMATNVAHLAKTTRAHDICKAINSDKFLTAYVLTCAWINIRKKHKACPLTDKIQDLATSLISHV